MWFAHGVPYTYTDMNKDLIAMRDNTKFTDFVKVELLAMTLSKLPVPMLTITEDVSSFPDHADELRHNQATTLRMRKQLRQLRK